MENKRTTRDLRDIFLTHRLEVRVFWYVVIHFATIDAAFNCDAKNSIH